MIDVTTGNELVVRTLYSSTLSQAIPVQYRIMAPKGVLVAQVETSTGRINVDEVSGDVDAKTSTGDIQIHKVNGLVKAVTSCGKINVNEVSGDADARTSTGGIQLHKVDGFVKAVTSCGNIDITGIGGLSGARTDNGKISVEVPAIRDNLEIRSSNGGYGFPFPGRCRPTGGEHLQRANHLWRPTVNRNRIFQEKVYRKAWRRRRSNQH